MGEPFSLGDLWSVRDARLAVSRQLRTSPPRAAGKLEEQNFLS
jgi:hypothetical protein